MHRLRVILFAVSVALLPGVASAERNLFLSGLEVTSAPSGYLYAGTAIPLPESSLAKGYVLHLWTDYQEYSYEAGATDVDASINSLSVAIGYHDSGIDFWWNTRLGIVQSDTRLRPDDPGNDTAGSDTSFKLQLEGEKRLSADSRINANLEYIFGRSAYWTRVRYLMKNDDQTYDGPEFVYMGDPAYSALQLGWALTEVRLGEAWSLGAKAGLRLDDGDVSAYAGVELSAPY